MLLQSWCPGCLSQGLPTIKELSEKYQNNKKIQFLAVQTVFEGFGVNSFGKIHSIRRRFGLRIPMAHDDGAGKGSILMRKYKSRGTPWAIIIDQNGNVIYSNFHITPQHASKIIDDLLNTDKNQIKSIRLK